MLKNYSIFYFSSVQSEKIVKQPWLGKPITVVHQETPSPLNSLGVKGLGEGGAIAPPVVIANAVCDALRPFKTELNSTPVRWSDIAAVFGDDPFATDHIK